MASIAGVFSLRNLAKNKNLLLAAGFVLFSGLMFVAGRQTAPVYDAFLGDIASLKLQIQVQQREVDRLRRDKRSGRPRRG